MADHKKFATLLEMLAEYFNQPLTKPVYAAYWLALSQLEDAELEAAVARSVSECKFMPRAAELLAFARPVASMAARSAAAWIAVRGAIRRYDYTVASIDFGPLVNTVLRAMGSWEWLCELGDEAMKWEAKRFAELFEAFAASPPEALRSEPIRGWGENRVGCEIAAVPIAGELPPIDPRRTLAEPPNPMRDLVRELAEAKSQAGVAAKLTLASGRMKADPPLPREIKPPARITDEEKAAALSRMEEQLRGREVAT